METWLCNGENIVLNELLPPGYDIRHVDRGRRGGGVALIYKKDISFRNIVTTNEITQFELFDCIIKVKHIILSLKSAAAGCDNFPAYLGKQCINAYIMPLTYILNQSMTEGVFPDLLKTARVIPLYKSGEKKKINNYRPISILSFFSKIFEKNYVQLHLQFYG